MNNSTTFTNVTKNHRLLCATRWLLIRSRYVHAYSCTGLCAFDAQILLSCSHLYIVRRSYSTSSTRIALCGKVCSPLKYGNPATATARTTPPLRRFHHTRPYSPKYYFHTQTFHRVNFTGNLDIDCGNNITHTIF